MLDVNLSEIETQLKQAVGAQSLRALGGSSGFVIREREITADRFVPSLIKSLGSHSVESMADLVRDFNHDHDLAIHYKPYYEKGGIHLTAPGVEFRHATSRGALPGQLRRDACMVSR